jgi:hypothetical protein
MSSHIIRNTFLALSLAVLAIPAKAANVSTDYDHNANFRSYHTFSFYKVQTSDPLFEQRIKDEVTKDLTQAGWQPVASGGDVAITAIGNVHDKQEYNTFYNGLGGGGWGWRGWGGWGGGWGTTQTTVETVPVGTLMLDMYDKNTHQLIWRGRSMSDLSNKSDKNTKTLDKDIDKMLNGFPPSSKG